MNIYAIASMQYYLNQAEEDLSKMWWQKQRVLLQLKKCLAFPPSCDGKVLSGHRVLVVDDSPIARSLYKRFAKKLGALECLDAENGEQALNILNQKICTLVFLDFEMPIMDGAQLAKKMKGSKHLSTIPIVMISSCQGVDESLKGLLSASICKPCTLEKIGAVVQGTSLFF